MSASPEFTTSLHLPKQKFLRQAFQKNVLILNLTQLTEHIFLFTF